MKRLYHLIVREAVMIFMLPLEIIKKYYPNLSDEELKKIQVFVYQLCCGLMQYFYGPDWEKDIIDLDLENQED